MQASCLEQMDPRLQKRVSPWPRLQLPLPIVSLTARQLGQSLGCFNILNLIWATSSSGDARETTLTAEPDWMKTLTQYILHGLNNFRKEREAQTLGSSCQVTLSESQVRDLPNALSGTGLESQLALKTDFCLFPNTILSIRLASCVTCAVTQGPVLV